MVECPKCGFGPVQSAECARCGIILAKYLERNPDRDPQRAETVRSPEGEPSHPVTDGGRTLEHRVGRNPVWLDRGKALFKRLVNRLAPDRGHANRLADSVFHGLVVLLITLIFYAGLLHVLRVMWIFYVATPVGEQFVQGYSERAREIIGLLDEASFLFAFEVTLTAFLICLTVGAACRLLHITTFLYHSTGAFSRILLCGIPLAGIVAWWIGPRYGFEVWSIAYATALIPTLCAYHVCFSISSALFPEIGGILHRLTPLRARVVRKIFERIDKTQPQV